MEEVTVESVVKELVESYCPFYYDMEDREAKTRFVNALLEYTIMIMPVDLGSPEAKWVPCGNKEE